jgi:hypothetical protein|tara:strand:+ start:2761 stop:2922 length:162 start_codon:yes stop_codon:yes gene_type:complete
MSQKAPKQDNKGYGLKAGAGRPSPQSRKSEQDGQNRLLKESDFNDRNRMVGNE